MDRKSFSKLCQLIKTVGGLKETRHMSVEEMVASFLHIVAHPTKKGALSAKQQDLVRQ